MPGRRRKSKDFTQCYFTPPDDEEGDASSGAEEQEETEKNEQTLEQSKERLRVLQAPWQTEIEAIAKRKRVIKELIRRHDKARKDFLSRFNRLYPEYRVDPRANHSITHLKYYKRQIRSLLGDQYYRNMHEPSSVWMDPLDMAMDLEPERRPRVDEPLYMDFFGRDQYGLYHPHYKGDVGVGIIYPVKLRGRPRASSPYAYDSSGSHQGPFRVPQAPARGRKRKKTEKEKNPLRNKPYKAYIHFPIESTGPEKVDDFWNRPSTSGTSNQHNIQHVHEMFCGHCHTVPSQSKESVSATDNRQDNGQPSATVTSQEALQQPDVNQVIPLELQEPVISWPPIQPFEGITPLGVHRSSGVWDFENDLINTGWLTSNSRVIENPQPEASTSQGTNDNGLQILRYCEEEGAYMNDDFKVFLKREPNEAIEVDDESENKAEFVGEVHYEPGEEPNRVLDNIKYEADDTEHQSGYEIKKEPEDDFLMELVKIEQELEDPVPLDLFKVKVEVKQEPVDEPKVIIKNEPENENEQPETPEFKFEDLGIDVDNEEDLDEDQQKEYQAYIEMYDPSNLDTPRQAEEEEEQKVVTPPVETPEEPKVQEEVVGQSEETNSGLGSRKRKRGRKPKREPTLLELECRPNTRSRAREIHAQALSNLFAKVRR
ncbi:uncharacterized protein LOC126748735 isoform X3 [Anthonomus grandis grandis]|uniref:uncharacterized protein LOC126748735 isoform X3 n=1 Tax=Anthonomus grandis grandis TaxID=2921223 RepID=UPI002165C8D6|nr:uncharacterized protein LOC126748735 isoform X3 [Anthonomus grandis grandis]